MAIGAYLALGVVVLASRLLAPAPKVTTAIQAEAPAEALIVETPEIEYAKAA